MGGPAGAMAIKRGTTIKERIGVVCIPRTSQIQDPDPSTVRLALLTSGNLIRWGSDRPFVFSFPMPWDSHSAVRDD